MAEDQGSDTQQTTLTGRFGDVRVYVTAISPEARDCLDDVMVKWHEFRAQMTTQPTDEVYTFAYWLIRYSGLVAPRSGA